MTRTLAGGVEYDVRLADDRGNPLDSLNTFVELEYTIAFNEVGSFAVHLPYNFSRSRLGLWINKPDRQVQIWRKPPGVIKRLVSVGFIRKLRDRVRSSGLGELIISGPDQTDLLNRRIVAYDAGESETDKTDYADDMAKEIVAENLGASAADSDRDISGLGLSIQADLSAAPSISMQFARRNVLETIKKIAETSEREGTRLFFRIVPTGRGSFEFRTWVNQPGRDRTSGNSKLIFSMMRGNLAEAESILDRTREATVVYAGGQGEESDREVEEREDTTRSGLSAFNRIEVFQDARNVAAGDTAALQAAGDARLNRGLPIRSFTGKIADTDTTRMGRDWNVGDLVIADHAGLQFACVIKAATFKVSERGELVRANLEWLG